MIRGSGERLTTTIGEHPVVSAASFRGSQRFRCVHCKMRGEEIEEFARIGCLEFQEARDTAAAEQLTETVRQTVETIDDWAEREIDALEARRQAEAESEAEAQLGERRERQGENRVSQRRPDR